MNKTRAWIDGFILAAGGLLLAAGIVRFIIAGGNAQSLAQPDPLLEIPLRLAVLLIGGIEFVVALVCLFGSRRGLQILLLVWLATNYLAYQGGLVWMEIHPQGSSLGSLTDPLKLARGHPGRFLGWLPGIFILGSYAAALGLWLDGRKSHLLKMACPSCGGHIKFARQNLGGTIPCPHCQTTVTLRKPDANLKMSCFFCQEHIAFPAHAIGQKMPCPHCQKDITLKESA